MEEYMESKLSNISFLTFLLWSPETRFLYMRVNFYGCSSRENFKTPDRP